MVDAVFVPQGAEERVVRRALAGAGSSAVVFITRLGAAAAGEAAERALAGAPAPRRVLITGLCGALSPAFRPGDLLLYSRLSDGGRTIETDPALSADIARAVPAAQSGVHAVEVGEIVVSAAGKEALAAATEAQAVDMESYTLAERLTVAGSAVAVLRAVSDGAGDHLPDFNWALEPSGELNSLRLALAMLRRPAAAVRTMRSATRALRHLAAAHAAILRSQHVR